MNKTHLVVIDPQVDFCDPSGALYVHGAEKDMSRLGTMLKKHGNKIDGVSVTLDSHQLLHIAHPQMWLDSNGNQPSPFTQISKADVIGNNPKWRARYPAWQKRQIDYVNQLETNGRYSLIIWPPHCLIGSHGASIHPEFFSGLYSWMNEFNLVRFVTKGSNIFTEHYSGIVADVVDPNDPSTGINTSFVREVENNDVILVAGEASSHCVANTLRDLVANFGPDSAKKVVILEDGMSRVTHPIPTVDAIFEQMHTSFFADMKKLGVRFSTTTSFFA